MFMLMVRKIFIFIPKQIVLLQGTSTAKMSTVSLQHITVMVLMIVEMAVMSLAAVRFLYYPCTILNQLAIIININNISNFAIHVQSKNIIHIIGTVSSKITLVVLFSNFTGQAKEK